MYYSDTREGDMIQSMLAEFRGRCWFLTFTLLYDSIKLWQPKVLDPPDA